MPVEITIPKFGLTMTEAQITEWKKQEGDEVKKGDVLFVLETEKVTYEYEAPEDGCLAKIMVAEKETVPVGTVVAYLLRSGERLEDLPSDLAAVKISAAAAGKAAPMEMVAPQAADGKTSPAGEGKRIKASPAAKKKARLLKVDLQMVTGTGPGGSIVTADVENAAESAGSQSEPSEADGLPATR